MRWVRSSWVDIVWAVFVVVNLLGMREMGAWSTIPFLVIWVSLTLVYGWRMWRLQPAILTVAVVTLAHADHGGARHAELIGQSVTDQMVAEDARVVIGELARLRRLSSRMLLLASVGSPGFLDLAPVGVDSIVIEALDRWGYAPRRWRLGEVSEATVPVDRDRLAVALDALLENAVAHTDKDDRIELSARVEAGHVILAVTDSGCGMPEADLERIFGRFSRATPYLSREIGGFGLGLPTAAAIAEAHHGSVRVNSTVGQGSTFELLIPAGQPAHGDSGAGGSPGTPAAGAP